MAMGTQGLKFAVVLLSVNLLAVSSAAAHGALAVGAPPDIAKGGLAVGYSWNQSAPGTAEAEALKQCLSFMDAPAETRALCKVVATTHNQCIAVAMDPAAGTEGFGWSVETSKQQASDFALQKCRDTDGPEHEAACVVSDVKCDVTK